MNRANYVSGPPRMVFALQRLDCASMTDLAENRVSLDSARWMLPTGGVKTGSILRIAECSPLQRVLQLTWR